MSKASRSAPATRRPLRSIRGATAIEYGLIASLVVVVMLASLTAFGNSATGMFNNIANRFVSATAR